MDCNRGFSVLYMKFRTMGNIISTFKDGYYCGGIQLEGSTMFSILKAKPQERLGLSLQCFWLPCALLNTREE